MALPATDAFTRGPASNLGSNWTHAPETGTDGCEIDASNVVVPHPTFGNVTGESWNADVFNNDQYAQAKLIALGGHGSGPFVRSNSATVNTSISFYGLYCEPGNGITLYRVDPGPSFNVIAVLTATVANNDVVKVDVQGTTLRGYRNGSQVGSNQTDATYGSGAAGLWTFASDATTLDDWEGGNLGGGGGGGKAPAAFHRSTRFFTRRF